MPNIGPMIAASARLGVGLAERLLKDIQPDQFARLARIGETVIDSNHPAFICGHLSLYAPKVISEVGVEASSLLPPAAYQPLFSKDARCVDDPEGTIYPPMDELTAALLTGYRAVVDALETAEDEVFTAINPSETMRSRFPTKGAMHAFYVGGHFMVHMGQLSAWRRAMGLGPA